jgi:LysR family tdc operon transcriptional activator
VTRAFSLLCLPDALQRFHNRYPDARLTIRDAFVSEILPMLRDGTIDVAITSLLPEVLGADLSFEPLGDVAVAISARAGAFSRDAYRLADLTESVWLLDHSHGGTSERGRQWFAEHDVPLLAQIIECPSSMASLVLTTQGKAIAPVPQAILSIPWLAPLLSEIHLEEPLPTTPIGLVKRKGNVPDAPVGWFVESARLAIAAVLGLNLDKLRE